MLAHVHDGVGTPGIAQPAVEGVVVVGGRQVGLVVDGVGVHAVAAGRLQHHQGIAQGQAGQGNVAVVHVGFAGGRPPLLHHLLLQYHRQFGKPRGVLGKRHLAGRARQLRGRQVGLVVGAAVYQLMNQRGARWRQVGELVALGLHGVQQL